VRVVQTPLLNENAILKPGLRSQSIPEMMSVFEKKGFDHIFVSGDSASETSSEKWQCEN
jgi:hypothetical protein